MADDNDLRPISTRDPRIRDGEQAWRLIRMLINDDAGRSKSRAKVRGMLDGNPPYRPDVLKRMGQADRANLNFREAEGFVGGRMSSYFDLVMNADPLVNVVPATKGAEFVAEDQGADVLPKPMIEYGDVIAREFQNLLDEWGEFLFHTMRHQMEMLAYGIGPVIFPSTRDWRFRAIPTGDMLVPPRAPANVDEQNAVVVVSSMSVQDLMALVSDPEQEEASKEAGWNVSLVKHIIQNAYNSLYSGREHTWDSIQQMVKTNSLIEETAGPAPMSVYYLFYRDGDGKVAVRIVSADPQEKRFLFGKDGMYDHFSQVVNMFFLSIGDGTYHSVRGLGYRIFPHCEVSNRFLNSLVDGARLASSAVVHQRAGAQPDAFRTLRMGPMVLLPQGYELADKSFSPNLQGLAEVRNILRDNLNTNIGMYRPTGEGIGAKTAREVNTIVQREAQLESTDINFYYKQWDRLYREMLRRLFDPDKTLDGRALEDRKQFISRCEAQGVPSRLLKDGVWKITSVRAIGNGSPALRDINSREVLELTPMMDRKGKHEAVRNRLLTLVGPTNVDRFSASMTRRELPVVNSSLARLESGMMNLGYPATAGDGEDHLAHLEIHTQAMAEMEQRTGDQQVDWAALVQALRLHIAHSYEHIAFIRENPMFQEETSFYLEVMKEAEQQLQRWTAEAEAQAQAAQAAQQEEQQLPIELQKERIKAEATLAERMNKEENMAHVRQMKAEHQMAISELKTQHQMEMDRIKQQRKETQ